MQRIYEHTKRPDTIKRYQVLRVSKKSTRSPVGMPFARKSKIFGLHSIPANTTSVFLKSRLLSGFSLTRCFFDAPVAEKTKSG